MERLAKLVSAVTLLLAALFLATVFLTVVVAGPPSPSSFGLIP